MEHLPKIKVNVHANYVQMIVRENASPYSYIERATGDPEALQRILKGTAWGEIFRTGQEPNNETQPLEAFTGFLTITLTFDGDKYNCVEARHVSPVRGSCTLTKAFESILGDKILRNIADQLANRDTCGLEKTITALRASV